ncbi:4-hydroxy-tetrahydrodipicolinate synthase [Acidothermaceae bacterium B102]|nr:4-hydroxy-tetrahydrodipicolinate synthase [Acidothermaceae bacterium B102]
MPEPATTPSAPFGRVLVAMVTPFLADGSLDVDGAQRLATHLIDSGCDGLVVNGTTGESPTCTDDEQQRLVRAVVDAVGGRAHVVAGAGSNDTAHSVELARSAEKAGATGLLVVTPYYNKPPQAGLVRHFTALADATALPTMLYDIPHRTGTAIRTETILKLASHERIVAVKDAKDDLAASSWVLARTDLAYYCGSDALNLPMLSIGAVGFVSVVGHFFAADLQAMIAAYDAGDNAGALAIHRRLLPAYQGIFATQGVITTKAALALLGLPGGPVRAPLVDATDDEVAALRVAMTASGVDMTQTTASRSTATG